VIERTNLNMTRVDIIRNPRYSFFGKSFWIKERERIIHFEWIYPRTGRAVWRLCSVNGPVSQLHNRLVNKPSAQRICEIIREAVDIEHEFVCDALPVSLLGMNKVLMSQYIEFCADRLLVALQQPRTYKTPNPFDWMTPISLQGKTNFFEKRVGEYAKAGVGVPTDKHHEFSIEADF
jgi:hypothetical protein